MSLDAKLVAAGFGFILTMAWVFGLIGVIDRTETPPQLQLTLNRPGCEYIKTTGITADINNGICTITVRYRKNRLNEGGTIEKNGIVLSTISSGQVVSFRQLDDGSDEPWSEQHRQAFEWLLAPALLMIFILVVLSLIKDLPEETKPRSVKTKPNQPDANADKPDMGGQIELPTSGIQNDTKQENK